MSDCKHPVTHINADGLVQCLICDEIAQGPANLERALSRAYADFMTFGYDAPSPIAFTGLSGHLGGKNG